MPVAERDNALSALALANDTRELRSRQRRALKGAPARTMFPVLMDPPAELASYRLRDLFGRSNDSLVPLMGEKKLHRLLERLNRGRVRTWHDEIRWRDLSKSERRAFLVELKRRGPKTWRAT